MRLFVLACVFLLLPGMVVSAQTDFQVITAESISELVPIQNFDGACEVFHPQGALVATHTGLYNLANGTQRIDVSDVENRIYSAPNFSRDGRWAVIGDSIYAVDSGAVLYQFEYPDLQNVFFSDDGRYAHSYDISFNTQSWEAIDTATLPDFAIFIASDGERRTGSDFNTGNGIPRYLSGNDTYRVQVVEGIYEVSTGELLDLPEEFSNPALLESGVFSPDDSLFFTGGDGIEEYSVYDVPSFEFAYDMSFDAGHAGRLTLQFSPDSQYFAARDEGVYLAETGELLFEIAGYPVFSPDNMVVGTGDGLYRLPDGEQIITFSNDAFVQDFTSDGRLVAVIPGGVFDVATGEQPFAVEDVPAEIFFSMDDSLLYHSPDVYDVTTGEVVYTLPSRTYILSRDERYIGATVDGSCQVFAIPPLF